MLTLALALHGVQLISQGGFEREISNLSSASRNLDVYR